MLNYKLINKEKKLTKLVYIYQFLKESVIINNFIYTECISRHERDNSA